MKLHPEPIVCLRNQIPTIEKWTTAKKPHYDWPWPSYSMMTT